MRIGILGSGLMGAKLGTLFARAGHEVTFSYSHDVAKLERLALDAGHGARACTPRDAAERADVVLLAIHWSRLDDVLQQTGDLAGKTVVTCSLPMNDENTALVIGRDSSGAEELAKRAPGAAVVSAFGTVPSEVLFAVYEAREEKERPSLVYCGDDESAKATTATLIRDLGFDPVDAGALDAARWFEPFALLVARLAYETDRAPAIAYRFVQYRETDVLAGE